MAENKSVSSSTKVENFLSGNRKFILFTVIALILCACVVGACFGIIDSSRNKAVAAIEEIEYAYTKDSAALNDDEANARSAVAMEALKPYLAKKGVVGVRSNMLAGSIAYTFGNTSDACNYYVAAANADKKAYTYYVNVFNAGSCYLDLGDYAAAEKYFTECADDKFDLASHAYFNLGMARELNGNTEGAIEAYTHCADKYSAEDGGKLSQSRLIYLDSKSE